MSSDHLNKTSKRKTKSIFIGILTIIVLSGLLLFGHSIAYSNKVLPRIKIGGVEVGGLTKEEATKKIQDKISSTVSIIYQSGDKTWEFKLVDIGVKYDLDKSVSSAYDLGKIGGIWLQLGSQIKSLFSTKDLPFIYSFDDKKYQSVIDQNIASQIEDKQLEAKIEFIGVEPKIIEGKVGQRIDRDRLLSQTQSAIANPVIHSKITINLSKSQPLVSVEKAQPALESAKLIVATDLKLISPNKEFTLNRSLIATWIASRVVEESSQNSKNSSYTLTLEFDKTKVAKYIDALKSEVDIDAVNARVTMENGQPKILTDSTTGLELKKDPSVEALTSALLARTDNLPNKQINLITEKREPEIKADQITNLGIKELIGKASTDFTGSSANRTHNITVGASLLSGTILKDGQEFSALAHLGKVDESQGFVPEKVIKNNKLTLELGGGLCQNASTMFRAVLDAGLPVTERQNHSRRVSYYEKPISEKGVNIAFDSSLANIGNLLVGYDSTVFIPHPDLKFKNNTGKAIFVQEYVVGHVVFAEIYGTKDGRIPSVSKAEVISIISPPATIYHDAPDLPKGTNEQIIKAVPGAKTKFKYTVKYPDGHEDTQEFSSYYKPVTPEVKVGSAEPAPTPTP